MKPITITLHTTIDEEIDQAIYGDFYAFSRFDPVHPGEFHPWVQMKQDGEWIPVQDWKGSRYMCTASTLRRLARHFIEVGKRLSGLIDPKELREAIALRMIDNARTGTETGGARATEDNDILGLIDTLCKDKEEQK